jgi:hypothetical protein
VMDFGSDRRFAMSDIDVRHHSKTPITFTSGFRFNVQNSRVLMLKWTFASRSCPRRRSVSVRAHFWFLKTEVQV